MYWERTVALETLSRLLLASFHSSRVPKAAFQNNEREKERTAAKSREAKENWRVKPEGLAGMKTARRRRRMRERERETFRFMNDRNLNCFSSSRWGKAGRKRGEVFVPPYKSQYSLVSAAVRERRRTTRWKRRIKVSKRDRSEREEESGAAVANGIWKYLVYGRNSRRFSSHVGFVARTNRKRRRNCVRRDNSSLCTSRTYLLFTAGYVHAVCTRVYVSMYIYACVCLCLHMYIHVRSGWVSRRGSDGTE